jgi:hypothetical protein
MNSGAKVRKRKATTPYIQGIYTGDILGGYIGDIWGICDKCNNL